MIANPKALILCLMALAAAGPPSAALDCEKDPRYRALDAWLGEWRVLEEVDGRPVEIGHTVLRRVAKGCAVEEVRRLSNGSEQRSLTVLDHDRDVWVQSWVSSEGDTGSFTVEAKEKGFGLSGLVRTPAGTLMLRGKMTVRRGGGFDENVELSSDNGKTFPTSTRTSYLPPGGTLDTSSPTVTPSPPLEARPAPQAVSPPAAKPAVEAEPTRVKVRSQRKSDAPVAMTAMESPMTVEVELGPLDAMPDGASWRTTELAPYVVEQVNMPIVTVGQRERRGKTHLELTVNLLAAASQAKVHLEAVLFSDEEDVATARGDNIKLGKLIRAHNPKLGLPYRLDFELEPEVFTALFAEGRRPSVRLTLTVD